MLEVQNYYHDTDAIDMDESLADATDFADSLQLPGFPKQADFARFVAAVFTHLGQAQTGEITLRLVNNQEMAALNHYYRGKDYATNVLSFPFEPLEFMQAYAADAADLPTILGDIAIAPDVLNQEAQAQHKTLMAHAAHLTVHGVLHLLGFDHEEEADANVMEAHEIAILKNLGFANPYENNP